MIAEAGGAPVGAAWRARALFPAMVLSVRETNPAVRLYERLGFRTVRQITNRAGTTSLEMRLDLRQ